MIILAVMFVLGACSGRSVEAGTAAAVSSAYAAEIAQGTEDAQGTEGTDGAGDTSGAAAASEAASAGEQEERTGGELLSAGSAEDSSSVTTDEAAYREAMTSQGLTDTAVTVTETGNYTSKDEVALYIHTYGKLPSNYITKQEAEKRGWDSQEGNLSDVLPGLSIGGSSYGNYEELLPKADGRKYYECDIDYSGGYRNAKRIVYSNDGLVFYTEDHYKTFEQLY